MSRRIPLYMRLRPYWNRRRPKDKRPPKGAV